MAPPATISASFEILAALAARDEARLAKLATRSGLRRVLKMMRDPDDERMQAVGPEARRVGAHWDGSRALCRFAELAGGRVAVLDLNASEGRWLLEDVRIIPRAEFNAFGEVDDRTRGGALPPGFAPPAAEPQRSPWPTTHTEVDVACGACGAVFRATVAPYGTAFCPKCGLGTRLGF